MARLIDAWVTGRPYSGEIVGILDFDGWEPYDVTKRLFVTKQLGQRTNSEEVNVVFTALEPILRGEADEKSFHSHSISGIRFKIKYEGKQATEKDMYFLARYDVICGKYDEVDPDAERAFYLELSYTAKLNQVPITAKIRVKVTDEENNILCDTQPIIEIPLIGGVFPVH